MKNLTTAAKLVGMGLLGATVVSGIARRLRRLDFSGKTVLIMGGSRGLALEMARCFAERGANLALAARDGEELKRAKKILGLSDGRVHTFVCDITDQKQVQFTVTAVELACGQIDVLVNNAGLIEVGPMELQTKEDYEVSMNTHFWGPLYTVEAVLPAMKRRRAGRIVNIASIAGLVSVPHLLPYSASKHALVGFSEGLRAEVLKHNIFVTTVCPGLMRTGSPMNADIKGHNKIEYALFTLLDALPFTSIDARKAAEQIVRACTYGDANLIISIQAQAAYLAHSLAKDLVHDTFAITNMVLPGEGCAGRETVKGRDSQSLLVPSLLTALSDAAAVRNNELGAKGP